MGSRNLHGAARITDADLVHLRALASIKSLELTYTQITDAGLEQVTGSELTLLNLFGDDDLEVLVDVAAVERDFVFVGRAARNGGTRGSE